MRNRALLVAAIAMVMAACGGGDETPPETTEASAGVTATTSLVTTTSAQASTSSGDSEPSGTVATEEVEVTVAEEVAATTTATTEAASTGTAELTSDDVVTLRALGPVTLGMTVEEAVAASGLALSQDFGRASTDNCYYVTAGAGLPGVAFMVVDGAVVRVEINAPSVIATRSGVRIGTPESSVREVYPDNIQQANDAVSEGQALAFVPNDEADADYRIYFAIDGGEVSSYRLGIRPAVDNLLGCQG
ncbi:MAG: hypothetical protein F4Y40_10525 [Acidimicrobiia bacterium]|nr:hypothetical protein [Acidimicrobiia bacterium]MYF83380.1 hypothetical protein [Acidimicrobiia bacterium]